MTPGEIAQSAAANLASRDLGIQISGKTVRHPHVQPQHLHQRVIDHALGHEFERRNSDAFLIDLGRVGRDRAR